ncbi:hypothetical protein KM043_014739 [Ampulex compressa]|nr:hypothetical protein KM043_014739 [Ampulex compressa]
MANGAANSSLETKEEQCEKKDDDREIMDRLRCEPSTTPVPPDGGWGYFVVLASFLIHVITDGVTYSFGVFYLELLYYFEEGKGATAWIASILVGITLCSGPISGSFVNKYGCRSVTIVGSILASACLLASVWAPSIVTLYFTIGIGAGFGFGLIYLPAIVSVTCYFEKYRSLATGIAVCGSGLGTLVFAPCLEYLIAIYGWRGAIMICAGIVLNCIVLGAFFRPLEPVKTRKEILPEDSSKNVRQNRSYSINSPQDVDYCVIGFRKQYTDHNIRSALSQPVLISKVGNHDTDSETIVKSFGSGGVLGRRDALYQGSLENIRKKSIGLIDGHAEELVRLKSSPRKGSCTTECKEPKDEACEDYVEAKGDVFQEMLDMSLLRDPIFILFTLSNFCTSIGFNVPYVYILPQAEERGINKTTASYLLAVIGVANTLGRIVLGYISDKPYINRLLIYNLCLTICGISTMLSVLCDSFGTFAFYCTVYGFTAGAYVGLTSVILVDLLGLNRLTNAFGLLLLFQGFASLLGPPVAGWLYDSLISYDPGFYVAGTMIAISGLMLFFIPTIQRRKEKNVNRVKAKGDKDTESI